MIRACRVAGLESVAVYSDADAGAPHVLAADRAARLGPAPAADSYLNVAALLDAARAHDADAVHPGYGFLSERAHFARAVEDAGLTFIGPPAAAIERLGSKTGARRLMDVSRRAGGAGRDAGRPERSRHWSPRPTRIGCPLLVKPAAGGGGIGMKAVHRLEDLPAALAQARREATAAFGNGTLYIERLVERPRHVEVQVFGDRHGALVHLFERECSAQRRHQKVIEETPCPALTPALRARMGAAAVAAAAAAGYQNAGTVEFLLEGDGRRRAVLLPRDQHPAPGRAPDHRMRRRRRPGPGPARGRRRRAAAVAAGGSGATRPRHRVPGLRRGSGARLPAAGRAAASLPGAVRARSPGRLRRRRGARRSPSTTTRCSPS